MISNRQITLKLYRTLLSKNSTQVRRFAGGWAGGRAAVAVFDRNVICSVLGPPLSINMRWTLHNSALSGGADFCRHRLFLSTFNNITTYAGLHILPQVRLSSLGHPSPPLRQQDGSAAVHDPATQLPYASVQQAMWNQGLSSRNNWWFYGQLA